MQYDMRLGGARARGSDLSCDRCGETDFDFHWQTFANGTRHIRVTCRCCGAFVRYAAQTAANVERADAGAELPR